MSAVPANGIHLEFCTDPVEFLHAAGEHLAADPVVSTVVTTVAHRLAAQERDDALPRRDGTWWLVVRQQGRVVGAGMRTATFPPYPAFLLPMPDRAAVALARAVHERGEPMLGVNGALPTAMLCAAELARLRGGRVEVAQRTRLHELGGLRRPPPVPGGLRVATEDDLALVTRWYAAFMGDADEQAGRPRGSGAHELPAVDDMRHRLRDQRIWLWVDGTGTPVHLTAANPPAFGVARIGPVYTPPAQRGRGWASSGVAEVSRLLLTEGARVCLFTDQANPTSSKVYAALGYEPVVDMANLVLVD
jgi:FR47-like protein